MSRVGRQPVAIPKGVTVEYNDRTLTVKGPKAKEPLVFKHHQNMTVEVDEAKKEIRVTRPNDERQNRAFHGLTRSLIQNMIVGVTEGYEKKLKIEGIGYQARLDGPTVELSVGFANKIRLTPPTGVNVVIDKDNVSITVSGPDKQKVGQFAAELRAARKPEPYQGKGVHYLGEQVRRKEGKTMGAK